MPADTCNAPCKPSCDRPSYANGLCEPHNRRKLRGQSLDTPVRSGPPKQAFSTYLPAEVRAELEAEATRTGSNVSDVAREALRAWAVRQAKKAAK
jgi:hypothetical protein